MIRNSGTCARCGKEFETADGDTHLDRNYGVEHGKLIHTNPFVCIRALKEQRDAAIGRAEAAEAENAVLKDELHRQADIEAADAAGWGQGIHGLI